MQQCPICLTDAPEARSIERATEKQIKCRRCGSFTVDRVFLDGVAPAQGELSPNDRRLLSGIIRAATDTTGALKRTITAEYKRLFRDSWYPRNPLEQCNHLLLELADRTEHLGAYMYLDPREEWVARGFLSDDVALQEVFFELIRMGFVSKMQHGGALTITGLGWEHIQNLQQNRRRPTQAFVAMWFHPDMVPAYDDGISPALKACGYTPVRVDRANDNSKIDDAIVANLRKSGLVVVDMTGARNSVYYEAGFAHGLGVPIVFTCNDAYRSWLVCPGIDDAAAPNPVQSQWFKDLAFDVRQYPCLSWKHPKELRTALENRICALGLDIRPPHSPSGNREAPD